MHWNQGLLIRVLAWSLPCLAHAQGIGVRKVCQLIGDFDRTLRTATLTQTNQLASIGGTDLGSSFEHKGRLYFLFGDTITDGLPNLDNRDTLVYTTSANPWNVTFTFPFATGNQYKPISVPGATHGGFCIPSGGVSYADVIYMAYTNQWYDTPTLDPGNMEKCFMCKSTDDGNSWQNKYALSQVGANHDMTNTHFVNVSMSIVSAANSTGLPYPAQDNLVIFGSGAYRKSALYLAAMPATMIDSKSTLRYFAGFSGSTPQWSTSESAAVSLKTASAVDLATNIGEFSAQYIPQLGKWVVLWRGVQISTADHPWGPYSAPVQLWHPWENDGYGNFLHVPTSNVPPYDNFGGGPNDVPNSSGDRWGGPYGPYLVPRFTTGNATNCQLYFTLSTWNPYRTVLMRAQWPIPSELPLDPSPLELRPGDGTWTATAGAWFVPFRRVNTFTALREQWISTHDGDGNPDDDAGLMWRWLPRDEKNKQLTFSFHGGDEEIMLLEGTQTGPPVAGNVATIYADIKAGVYGRVVECAWGPSSNAVDHRAEWDLRSFDRANLKVVIIDHEIVWPWNFVSLSPLTLTRYR